MFRSFILAATAVLSVSAMAADLGIKKPSPVAAVSAACKETKALPADAFGFATGSDVADLGAWGLAGDTVATNGIRGGTSYTTTSILQLSGSFFPCLEVGPYIGYGYSNFKAYNAGGTTRADAFTGGLELKYKLLGRAPHGIGLTFAVTPSVAAFNNRPGVDGTTYAMAYRLLADREIIPGKLFGALNLEYTQTWTDAAGVANASFANIRGALTTPVTDSLYLGSEVSYQTAFNGNWINRYAGYAVYVGPTFLWAINDKFTLNGTWAYQVAGDAKVNSARALGIDIFARHLARVKLAYAF